MTTTADPAAGTGLPNANANRIEDELEVASSLVRAMALLSEALEEGPGRAVNALCYAILEPIERARRIVRGPTGESEAGA